MRKKIIETSYIPIKRQPLEVGQLVIKTAGRDGGLIGTVVEIINNNTVLIDGQVRRRKCNIAHLETLDNKIKIKPKATTDTIIKEFKSLDIEVKKTKPKPKKERLKKVRKIKEVPLEKKIDEKKVKVEEKPQKEKSKKKESKNKGKQLSTHKREKKEGKK